MHSIQRSSYRPIDIQNQTVKSNAPEASKPAKASARDDLAGFAFHNNSEIESRDYKTLDARLKKHMTPHLATGSRSFDKALKGGLFNVRSSELKSVVKQIEKTQNAVTLTNLSSLESKINQWKQKVPNEYLELGGLEARDLLREISIRKEDPLLGTSATAEYNSDLLKSVQTIYGDQVASFLSRVAPDLSSHNRTNIDTKDLLRQTLETPYLKSFQAAESMVSASDLAHYAFPLLDQEAISHITEQVAKLPEPLISKLQGQSVKVVVTKGTIEDHLKATTSKYYGSDATTANAYYAGKETKEVLTALHKTEAGWVPPNSKKEGFTNPVLFHLGAALDNTVGRAELGHPLRQDPEFVKAWTADKGLFGDDRVSRVATQADDWGLGTAFSEGFAKAFQDNGNERSTSTKKEWPAIQHYMTDILPKRLGVEFPKT